ncbi:MAG: hypothetical protein KGQ59_11590, partial [Bdellovibrionales bacterium]|nr:hypothetical protein [Bdellovibrionales bacterium]
MVKFVETALQASSSQVEFGPSKPITRSSNKSAMKLDEPPPIDLANSDSEDEKDLKTPRRKSVRDEPLPPGWTSYTDDNNRVKYRHEFSRKEFYSHPTKLRIQLPTAESHIESHFEESSVVDVPKPLGEPQSRGRKGKSQGQDPPGPNPAFSQSQNHDFGQGHKGFAPPGVNRAVSQSQVHGFGQAPQGANSAFSQS